MVSFHDVQKSLDRILGSASPGNHRAFWRGVTRDQFVALRVFGMKVVELGDPGASNLVLALRGESPFGADLDPPPDGAFLPRMPMDRPPAAPEEIELIEAWIREGCPDESPALGSARLLALRTDTAPGDDDHVAYWRDVDLFFLPGLASPETQAHVENVHVNAFGVWSSVFVQGGDPAAWEAYRTNPRTIESFDYLRLHQNRLIRQYYGDSQPYLFDSLWKFGGDLLPEDPNSGTTDVRHRMNGVIDWFLWAPYLHLSLTAADVGEADLRMARAWQVGIVADALLRGRRIRVPEFVRTDPDLRNTVFRTYSNAAPDALLAGMWRRAGG